MKTALVIEDNVDNMELISLILEKNGYKVLKAETGQQGFDVALEARPDFILLDIQLPDMDGLDVLRKIRSSKIDSGIRVIAMTSYAMVGDREKMMAAGCNG
ncbi:MAG: response regulator, partial [Candidatus Brocadiales bacterium]|nr:response regulator [Candidatus Bathyanammoxibius sp.]